MKNLKIFNWKCLRKIFNPAEGKNFVPDVAFFEDFIQTLEQNGVPVHREEEDYSEEELKRQGYVEILDDDPDYIKFLEQQKTNGCKKSKK